MDIQSDRAKRGIPANRISRRRVLQTSGMSALGLFSAPTWGAARAQYDFSDPEDNLEAFAKITGHTRDRSVYMWSSGRVFGSTPGTLADPLFDFQACRKQRYVKVADGYRSLYRGMIVFFDLKTKDILEEFQNPYTETLNQVTHYRTQLGEYTITPQGYRGGIAEMGVSGVPRDAPFVLDWTVTGDDVWVLHDERLKYTRPSGGGVRVDNLLNRYHCRLSELEDPGMPSVSCDITWQAELTWFLWMQMSGHPGHIFWGGMGRKYENIDALPARFVTAAETLWPGALSEPLIA